MILSAESLDVFDRCPRRYAFERQYESRVITPLGLLYAAVEGSLTASDPVQGAKDAIASITAQKHVDAGELSPLSAMKHVEATAEVVALALRERMGFCVRPEVKDWQSNLFECKGELHRIILCSHLDDDSLRSFAHSWKTIGELAALKRSITLTVVIVGAQRGGRRHSAWSKGYQHPVQKSLRFAPRKRDNGFTGNWTQVWREQTNYTPEVWLSQMASDEVLQELISSRRIQYNGDDARMVQVGRDLIQIAPMMEGDTDPMSIPMRRSSCDDVVRGACPWQACCYSPTPVGPEAFPHLLDRKSVV